MIAKSEIIKELTTLYSKIYSEDKKAILYGQEKIDPAHSTIVRFKSSLQNREKPAAAVRKYNEFDIGVFQVDELELVIHDWYNRKKEESGKFILK